MESKQKVFVVDDDKLIARSVSELLRVVAAFDAEAFFDAPSALLRANVCLPDILVTDVNMPEMDGITLANEMRKLNPVCKVIIMTGNLRVKTPKDLQTDGLDDFALLLKPFKPSQLLCLIKSEQNRIPSLAFRATASSS